MSTALETGGLGKRYGRTWALRDCSLQLPAGRVAALVGPNGAGKTTLLHLAVGLLRPDAGEVRALGQPPVNNWDVQSRIGFVAQETPLYSDFTADELITACARLNRRWDRQLAHDRLRQVDVPTNRRVAKLSGGQRAQVALALALAKRPELLLLDEPLASLDPLARREFLQTLMGDVADNGTTVLLSSHLLADLERVCDYLIVLQAAQVQVLGAVDELLARHKLLIGPRRESTAIAGAAAVIRASHKDKQSTLLVRTRGRFDRNEIGQLGHDPAWTIRDVTLEDLVLAYLADASVGVLPGPGRIDVEVPR